MITHNSAEAQPMCSQSGYWQPTITEAFDRAKEYNEKSPQALELNKSVVYYLAKDMLSLHTIEKPGFRYLVVKLDPSITFNSGNTSVNRKFPTYSYKSGKCYEEII